MPVPFAQLDPLSQSYLFVTLGSFVWLLLPFVLLSLAIPYAVLRIRDSFGKVSDPQLGMKAALHYFSSIGILLLLTGLTIIAVDVIALDVEYDQLEDERGGPDHDQIIRVGGAFALSGFVITLVNLIMLLAYTNDRLAVNVRRTFAGWRFAIHGIVLVTCFTACMVLLIQENDTNWQTFRVFLSVLAIWTPSALIHLILLWWQATQSGARKPAIDWEDDD